MLTRGTRTLHWPPHGTPSRRRRTDSMADIADLVKRYGNNRITDARMEEVVRVLIAAKPRTFDGWPTTFMYDSADHWDRLATVIAMSEELDGADHGRLYQTVVEEVGRMRLEKRAKYRRSVDTGW